MTRNSMMSETLAETLHGLMPGKTRAVPRRRRYLAGFTAGALALSVVMSSAMPVRADDNDDLLAALAALALLGVIINESNNDPAPPPPHYDYYDPYPYPTRHNILPPVCAIEVEARDHRTVVVYAESCLDRYDLDRLPQRCAHEIKVRGRRDWVYGQVCLRHAGFRPGNDFRSHERPD